MRTAGIIVLVIGIVYLCVFPPIGVMAIISGIIMAITGKSQDEQKREKLDEEFELWVKKQEYLEERKAQKAKAEKVNHDLDEIEAELDRRISDPERGINPDLRIIENRKD